MSTLEATLIDVGWGDSIFIEADDNSGQKHYALIDSNDTTYMLSSFIYLKRYFEKQKIKYADVKPVFDFIILTHAHSDHGQGLKKIFREFGTKHFWYSKSNNLGVLAGLMKYSNRSKNVENHKAVNNHTPLPLSSLGDVEMKVLWPPPNHIENDENNNSVVLHLKLGNASIVLSGDAEEDVWHQIADRIPSDTKVFKVPHHGSVNGTFDNSHNTPWFSNCPADALLGISSHIRPYKHPHREVIELFENHNRKYFRTDRHYHITFQLQDGNVRVKYSHYNDV
ncbi:MAG: MBL fold metallo-hydrolase [candidate division Zixibacteria bacterium]|nr:MBL fold metallo-hydrolase [candidate division Zixibacteria bacterium]